MSSINIAAWVADETGIEKDTNAKLLWNKTTDRPFSVYFNSYFWPCLWTTSVYFLLGFPSSMSYTSHFVHVAFPTDWSAAETFSETCPDLLGDTSPWTRAMAALAVTGCRCPEPGHFCSVSSQFWCCRWCWESICPTTPRVDMWTACLP